ncbi:hypothetical protein VOLCADRAFT_91115 [Volvox carteri f. nagariensis]|uniref:Domain of unknown function at the cortex 1 domain-containing protein n=1 Tax=Volvox carteri f. nagariensis TaxID=3068 RepID=D8TW79_VOLCA|nr:uncharacterized protein VOLCADRAFT_91115 [Volvox carteri f. nagariensis]EFJ48428.1 hypothetical protein VOLCADRAFT_91115 [Volvox carteri f. nagariensis]|eukprot:XP_002950682.1 hypothetical protein VOLCADRAFT_91115 [Volvox carteri f. nagariensis]
MATCTAADTTAAAAATTGICIVMSAAGSYKGTGDADGNEDGAYGSSQGAVARGRFKRPVSADRLLIGCHYRRPLRLGGSIALAAVLSWVSRLLARGGGAGGVELVLTGNDPRVRAPLAAAAHVMHVSRLGEQPPPLAACEDTRLMGLPLMNPVGGQPWSAVQRRQYFRRTAHRAAHVFDTEHVWTFHTWDQALGYGDCRLHTGLGTSVDLVPYLGDLPLQLLVEESLNGQHQQAIQAVALPPPPSPPPPPPL